MVNTAQRKTTGKMFATDLWIDVYLERIEAAVAPPNNNLMAADRWLQVAHSNLRVKEFTSNNSIVFRHYYCGNRRPPGTRWQAFSAFIRFFGKNNVPCRKPDLRNSESNMGYSSATASIDCGRQDGGSTSCMDMTATTVVVYYIIGTLGDIFMLWHCHVA